MAKNPSGSFKISPDIAKRIVDRPWKGASKNAAKNATATFEELMNRPRRLLGLRPDRRHVHKNSTCCLLQTGLCLLLYCFRDL